MNNTQTKTKGGKMFSGVVVSAKATDTLSVAVDRYVKHSKYGKYIKRRKKYAVHAPGGGFTEGDTVSFRECRPVSKTKRFVVVKQESAG